MLASVSSLRLRTTCRGNPLSLRSMALHLHRAERTDLLADGLGALLAEPLADPFAEELVLVPARGVERWLSQRLSHILGRGDGADGVCAGVAFRNPHSLIAEITGTADDDPWSPDAMVWPLLEVIDEQPRRAVVRARWPPTSATSTTGEEKRTAAGPALRRGAPHRRAVRLLCPPAPATARRLARRRRRRPRRRPATGNRRCGARSSTASTPTRRTSGTRKPLPGCGNRRSTCRRGCRCSGTPGCPSPRSNCSRRWPPITTCTCGCRTPATTCGVRSPDLHGPMPRRDDTSHRAVGHPLLATLGRDLRELQRSLPADPQHRRVPAAAATSPTPCWAGCSPTSPPTPFGRKAGHWPTATGRCRCTAATARPARSTCCARCCSACSPTTRRWSRATSW